jgi:Fanconi anemia group M protein
METQKILKPNKVCIFADYREREIVGQLKKLDLIVNEIDLEVGDFVLSDNRVVIERKSHSDFISSIIDGRLFEQAKTMKENFKNPIIIIEGSSNRQINENALKAAIASLLIDFNVSLLNTKNPSDTAKTIYWIAKKEQEENKHSVSFKVGKKPKEMGELQKRIVSSLPGINSVMSKRLLEHFETIEKVFTADEKELRKVKGVGKKLANKIKKILIEKYKGG